jgi:glycosyltransferase involved in cell wall biosynthesis
MREYLRSNITAFDIVHIHGLYRFPPTYAGYLARTSRVPYIIGPFGSLDPVLHGQSARSLALKRVYEWCFDRPSLNAAGAIHYTTPDEQRRSAHVGLRAPSFVLPNGLDWTLYAELPARGSWRRRLGVGERPLVLFVGRLHPVKGLEILLDAFARLRATLPETRLMIVGPSNDEYGPRLQAQVAREHSAFVHFVGHLEGSELLQAYVDADVFALPSHSESFGMTVAEAMACGIPVVISDQVRIQNDVAGAGAGIVTRRDASEVEAAVRRLLGNHAARRDMGAAGRRLAKEQYSWGQLTGRYDDEYERVIARTLAAPERRP